MPGHVIKGQSSFLDRGTVTLSNSSHEARDDSVAASCRVVVRVYSIDRAMKPQGRFAFVD